MTARTGSLFSRSSGGDRPDVEDVMIVITDGRANIGQHLISEQADAAEGEGIRRIAVGITSEAELSELQSIASSTREVLTTPTFNSLNELLDDLVTLTCEGPTDTEKGKFEYL